MSEKNAELYQKYNDPRDVREVFKNLSPEIHGYLINAQKLSKSKKHFYIGIEHFLASFISEPKSLLRKILKNPKANWKKKANDLLDKAYNPAKKQKLWDVDLIVTPRMQRLWDEAVQMTPFKDPTEVKEAHFLLVLLEDEENFACKWLHNEDYNVSALVVEIRSQARDAGIREDKKGEDEKEEEAPETEEKKAAGGKPSRKAKAEEEKPHPQPEKPLSIDEIFKRTDAVQAVKGGSSARAGAKAESSSEDEDGAEEVILVGRGKVTVQSLRERRMGDRAIQEIIDISKSLGSFPETLLIGEKKVSFDELMDMSLDEDAFLEVLEIAREHFEAPSAEPEPAAPAVQRTPVSPTPARQIPRAPEPSESLMQMAQEQPQTSYKTRDLAQDLGELDFQRILQARVQGISESESDTAGGDQSYSTAEFSSDLISKAKQQYRRAPAMEASPEPQAEESRPRKADPFGIGDAGESPPDSEDSQVEYAGPQEHEEPAQRGYLPGGQKAYEEPAERGYLPGGQKAYEEPPQQGYQQEQRGSDFPSEPISPSTPSVDPFGISVSEEKISTIFPAGENEMPSPGEPAVEPIPEQVEPISWKIEPFGEVETSEKAPDAAFFQHEVAPAASGQGGDISWKIGAMGEESAAAQQLSSDSPAISQPIVEQAPEPVFPSLDTHPGEREPVEAPPEPISFNDEVRPVAGQIPAELPAEPSSPTEPVEIAQGTENLPAVEPSPVEPAPAAPTPAATAPMEHTPVPASAAPVEEPKTQPAYPPVQQAKPAPRPVAERPRPSDTIRVEPMPVSPISPEVKELRVAAEVAREHIMARERAAQQTSQPIQEARDSSMLGIKRKVTLLQLYDIMTEEERRPVLFEDDLEEVPASLPGESASEERQPEFSSLKTIELVEVPQEQAPAESPQEPAPAEPSQEPAQPDTPADASPVMLEPEKAEVPQESINIPLFPVEDVDEGGISLNEEVPGPADIIMSAEQAKERYSWQIWDRSEAEEALGSIFAAPAHVALLSRSSIKAGQLLHFLKEKAPIDSFGNPSLYVLDTEKLKSFTIDEIVNGFNRAKGFLGRKPGSMLLCFDSGPIWAQDTLAGTLGDFLEQIHKSAGTRALCSMNNEAFETGIAGRGGISSLFTPVQVKDVTDEEARNFLKASIAEIEAEIQVKIDPALIEQAPEITTKFSENPVYPDCLIEAFQKAAAFKKEEFLDLGLDEMSSISKKDFLYIVSDSSQ